MDFGDFLVQVGDGNCGNSSQCHALQRPQAQEDRNGGCEWNQQSKDGGGADSDCHGADPADAVGEERPREDGDGQAHGGQGDAECRVGSGDAEVSGHKGQDCLGGIQLGERGYTCHCQGRQDPAVATGAFGVAVPGIGCGSGVRCFCHRFRLCPAEEVLDDVGC